MFISEFGLKFRDQDALRSMAHALCLPVERNPRQAVVVLTWMGQSTGKSQRETIDLGAIIADARNSLRAAPTSEVTYHVPQHR